MVGSARCSTPGRCSTGSLRVTWNSSRPPLKPGRLAATSSAGSQRRRPLAKPDHRKRAARAVANPAPDRIQSPKAPHRNSMATRAPVSLTFELVHGARPSRCPSGDIGSKLSQPANTDKPSTSHNLLTLAHHALFSAPNHGSTPPRLKPNRTSAGAAVIRHARGATEGTSRAFVNRPFVAGLPSIAVLSSVVNRWSKR